MKLIKTGLLVVALTLTILGVVDFVDGAIALADPCPHNC